MIAELFYPKELKEIIADLRVKDDLDEDALARMNDFIYKKVKVTMVFVVVLVVILLTQQDIVSGFLCFIFTALVIYAFFKDVVFYLRMYPCFYSGGRVIEGKYISSYSSLFEPGGWGVTYEYEVAGRIYRKHTGQIHLHFKGVMPKDGEKVSVFYKEKNPEKSTIFIVTLYQLFNLKRENILE